MLDTRVTSASTRAELEVAIAALRAKAARMPTHWIDRRQEIADEVDALVNTPKVKDDPALR